MVRIVKKPEERKKEILDAAAELFLTKGYEKTTISDVMRKLNIAKGTIYHYFKSKDELLDGVIDNIASEQRHAHEEILSSLTGNALERIEQFVLISNENHVEHDEFVDNLHKPANAGMHLRILAKHITLEAELYEEFFRQGCNEGLFSTENPLEVAEFILAGIQFLTDMGVYPWSDEQLRRRVDAFPGIIESLLNAPPGSFGFLLKVLT